MNQLELAYAIAKTQIGVKEISGLQHELKILEYHRATRLKALTDEVPWCSAFMNWCVIIAGLILSPEQYGRDLMTHGVGMDDANKLYDSAIAAATLHPELRAPLTDKTEMPTFSAMARSWLDWGTPTETPKEGDIVVYSRTGSPQSGHVGFYVSSNPVTIKTLGGNQGDSVSYKNYLRLRVLGYRTLG